MGPFSEAGPKTGTRRKRLSQKWLRELCCTNMAWLMRPRWVYAYPSRGADDGDRTRQFLLGKQAPHPWGIIRKTGRALTHPV